MRVRNEFVSHLTLITERNIKACQAYLAQSRVSSLGRAKKPRQFSRRWEFGAERRFRSRHRRSITHLNRLWVFGVAAMCPIQRPRFIIRLVHRYASGVEEMFPTLLLQFIFRVHQANRLLKALALMVVGLGVPIMAGSGFPPGAEANPTLHNPQPKRRQ